MGDWLIRHMAGSEIPADMGTKVLASERFNLLKKTMGMFLGEDGKVLGEDEKVLREEGKFLEKRGKVLSERKEKAVTQEINDGRVEVTKTALKALILFAKLVQAKGAENGIAGVDICATRKWMALFYHHCHGFLLWTAHWSGHDVAGKYIHFFIVSLWSSHDQTWCRDHPFLLHDLPENRRNQRSEAPQPRNTFTAPTTPSRPSAAAGSSSAVVSDAAAGSSSGCGERCWYGCTY